MIHSPLGRLCVLAVLPAIPLLARGETPDFLPGTTALIASGDLSMEMVASVDRFLQSRIEGSVRERGRYWSRDFSSEEAYRRSILENRQRFRRFVGVVDERLQVSDLELVASLESPSLVAETSRFRAHAVRWPVFEGVDAEGLLLEPRQAARFQVVVLPDADWTPEMVVGLASGVPPAAWMARRLAEAGGRVLVPTLIDRNNAWSGNPRIRMSNQTHREFLYRQAYFMGRHLIGYEVQKVLAAVDYFQLRATRAGEEAPIGVAGYGEGGLIAFYGAAVDERVEAVLVSGYFGPREEVWREPVYRNVWGLLDEFGDAEIAGLVAPRRLIVEACRAPEIPGPPAPRDGREDAATGAIWTPSAHSVRVEFERARETFRRMGVQDRIELVARENGTGLPGSDDALKAFLQALGRESDLPPAQPVPLEDARRGFEPGRRMEHQFRQLVEYSQRLVRLSPFVRREFWSKADFSSVSKWEETTEYYRAYLWDEIIGRLPAATEEPNPRTRLVYETPLWKGYDVVLDIWPEVFAYGMILVPKDLRPGERRPVVVAQHGRGGRPGEVCNPERTRIRDGAAHYYHSFGAQLADRGFIVYAPQNLYIGEEVYRVLQRKANPLRMTFFAPMVRQHEQALEWLSRLPFVDPGRIAFYGISYGGKSAMLIPAVLKGYALSICSADFNETVWKHASVDARYSFMFTKEHEHTEFDFGDKFNYGELAGLIVPRPFMVERGHDDGVAPDEWVAYEYAKVRRLYTKLGIRERTEIEFFDGGHTIHGVRTFDFLHRHLNWPAP